MRGRFCSGALYGRQPLPLNLLLPLNLPLIWFVLCRTRQGKFKTKMAPVKGAATKATARQNSRRGAGGTKTGGLLAILGELVAQEADEVAVIGEDVRFGRRDV
jgi:hypothetical protein